MLRVVLSSFFVGLALFAQPVAAQEALNAISSDAAVVIRVKAPKATTDRVVGFATAVDPNYGGQLKLMSGAIGQAIQNPTLAGVDMSADWYIAIYAPEEDGAQPTAVFVIPGSDLKAMEEVISEGENTFAAVGKYGVYSKDEDAVEAAKTAKEKSIAKTLAASQAVFDKGDFSVFVNVAALTAKYKDHIDEVEEKATEQLDNLPPTGAPGVDPEQIKKIAGMFMEGMFGAVRDTDSFTLSLSLSKTGVNLDELWRVKSGSAIDSTLQKSPPSSLDLLGSLPAGSQMYVGVSLDMSGLMEFASVMVGAMPGGEKQQEMLKESLAALKSMKYGPSVASFSITPRKEGGILSSAQISQITPTAKLKELSRKMAGTEIEQQGFKQITTLEADKETFGKYKADVVTTKFEAAEGADPMAVAIIQNVLNVAFGDEGLTQRVAYLPELVVQTMGGGKDLMQKTLAAMEKKGAGSAALGNVRKQVGAKSNLLFLIDLPNMIVSAGKALAEREVIPGLTAEPFEKMKVTESYVAFSAMTEPQGLRMTTVVPMEQIKGISNVVRSVYMAMQRGAAPADEEAPELPRSKAPTEEKEDEEEEDK